MICIHYSRDGTQHRLHITGHAGYAPTGSDIVCAAVSAISMALAEYLRPRGEAQWSSGHLTLRCRRDADADAAFGMALAGYRRIAGTYPQCAEVDTSPLTEADKREKTAGKEHEAHAAQHLYRDCP